MRSDFYFIDDQDYWLFSCRLTLKAYQQQHQVYLHMRDESDATKLNEMLWTFQQNSFIPHACIGHYQHDFPPVEIGYGDKPKHHQDILINLSQQLPSFINQFQRVIEIIPNTEEAKQRAERLLIEHQNQGFEIQQHQLRKPD